MSRILVTGVRAPAALDVMRSLSSGGYEVYAADCMTYPLGRFSSAVKAYLHLPPPRYAFERFQAQLVAFVKKHHIDAIVPICEEVFYLSACKAELEKHCHVFCEDIELLTQLHNKYAFQQLASAHGLGAINTFLVDTEHTPIPDLDEDKTYAVKPAFSRFGDKALLNLTVDQILQHLSAGLYPWVIQEYIKGKEFCSYAICRKGEVIAETCYQPYFRAKQGSSVYFKAVSKPEIFEQVRSFVQQLHYTGQIAFDFIEQPDGQLFVLECNPRCTSGAHLVSEVDWDAAFSDSPCKASPWPLIRSKMVSLGMLIYGLRRPNTHGLKEFMSAYLQADDVIYSRKDRIPSLLQMLSVFEMYWRSFRTGQSLKDASTLDIEWDGQAIG